MEKLKAPFPYFGGKSAMGGTVWGYLGKPDVYVEPFAGTAVMATICSQARGDMRPERIYVTFWRIIQHENRRRRMGRLLTMPGFDCAAQVADTVGKRTQCEVLTIPNGTMPKPQGGGCGVSNCNRGGFTRNATRDVPHTT